MDGAPASEGAVDGSGGRETAEFTSGASAGAGGAAELIVGTVAATGPAARSQGDAAVAVDDPSWLTDKTAGLVEEAAGLLDGAARSTGDVYSNSSSGISWGDVT